MTNLPLWFHVIGVCMAVAILHAHSRSNLYNRIYLTMGILLLYLSTRGITLS